MHRASFAQPHQNGGRSPYAAYAQTTGSPHNVSDFYSYVDEQRNVIGGQGYGQSSVFEDDEAPDLVHIRYLHESWSLKFPPFSIAEEKVQVRHVRDRVAQRLNLEGQEGKVKLMYKERELKINDWPLRKYGCKQNSEIVALVQSQARNYDQRHEASDSDSHASSKRSNEPTRVHRSNSTYRRRDPRDDEPRSAYPASNGHLQTPPGGSRQHSPNRPQPRREPAPRQSSPVSTAAPAIQPPTAASTTDLGKIQAMRYEFHSEWVPKIDDFLRSPPSDRDERTKEYRKLSEIAYKKVFEPGDAIEPDGPDKEEIRSTRKKLYSEATAVLKDLDRLKPQDAK